jgi:hypothetical protein
VKTLLHIIGWTTAALLLLQLIKVDIPKPPTSTPADAIMLPTEIAGLFKRSCNDCHSNTTQWPWYADIAPISFEVRGHVRDGRKWLNFDIWNQYDEEKKQERLKGIVKTIDVKMPLPSYLWAHTEAKLTKPERESIKKWAKAQITE